MNQTPDQSQNPSQPQAQTQGESRAESQAQPQQDYQQGQNIENLSTEGTAGAAAASGNAMQSAKAIGAGQDAATGTAAGQAASAGAGAMRRAAQPGDAILLPPVDVIEDAGGITLLADLPGVSREGLHLRLETNSLTIEGELSLDVPKQMDSRYAEVKHQHYQRTFALSRDLDAEQAVAELSNGVLRLRIPKARHAQPRKIDIKVA